MITLDRLDVDTDAWDRLTKEILADHNYCGKLYEIMNTSDRAIESVVIHTDGTIAVNGG